MFDFALVFSSLVHQMLMAVTDGGSSVNLTFVRSLRLFKMATLLRGIRVIEFLRELRTMLLSLLGSVASLMWGIVMLILIYYVFGLMFVQGTVLALSNTEEELDPEAREFILQEFGSVEASMLSMYMASTGGVNWSHTYSACTHLGWMYCFLCLFFIAFSQIALLNILTALFVNKAMDVAKPDKDTIAMEQRRKELDAYEELCALGRELEQDRSGYISVSRFESELRSGRLGARLALLGLNIADAEYFFDLLVSTGCPDKSMVVAFGQIGDTVNLLGSLSNAVRSLGHAP